MDDLETRLRKLAVKWVSIARHPQNIGNPEIQEAYQRCASQLMKELHLPVVDDNENDPGWCTSSSWRGPSHKPYGPGGYNRCIFHGPHAEHKDDFGNVWIIPGRILRHEIPATLA